MRIDYNDGSQTDFFLLSIASFLCWNFLIFCLSVWILENPVLISGFGIPVTVSNVLTATRTSIAYELINAEITYDSYLYAYEIYAVTAGLSNIYVLFKNK